MSILCWFTESDVFNFFNSENQTLASTRSHRIYKIETAFTLKMKKEMVIHPSIPAWRIPSTEEPGRLLSKRFQGVGQDWSNLERYKKCNLYIP